MNRFRKKISTLFLAGMISLGGALGFSAWNSSFTAHADPARPAANPPTQQQFAQAEDLANVFRHVGKQVEPAVVNIRVVKSIKGAHGAVPFDRDLFRRFFPDRGGEDMPDMPDFNDPNSPGGPSDEDFQQIGTGSGVFMEVDGNTGYILTNNHVAGGVSEISITLNDGRVLNKASVVGTDPKTDLAVIKVDGSNLPPPAKWGNSDELQQGDWIIAFGSPFGYVGSMTHGIVSALNRTNVGILPQQGYENFIQVDAPINPGNSGGPLVNLHGEVVGINTAIASRSGGFQGIGFAIPSNLAKFVFQELKTKHKVTRGWLGVSIADVTKARAEANYFGYNKSEGVLVEEVLNDTPAFGKLKTGDIITAINNQPVMNVTQLRNMIAATAPNTEVAMTIFREGKTSNISVKLGEQPEEVTRGPGGRNPGRARRPGETENGADALGLKFRTLNEELAQRFDLGATRGVVVTSVAARSLAARAGIEVGNVITEIDRKPVANAQEASDALSKVDLNKGVMLQVVTREGSRLVVLKQQAE